MQIDAVIKVISHFRENAQDILKLIQKSQTAHAESGLVTRVLMHPFTQLKTLVQSAKVLKGTIAVQTTIVGLLSFIGFSSYTEMPYWVYGVLFLFWYLLSLLQGLYLMQKMDKNNPFFFYKLFKVMHPAMYKAFEELAKNSDSFNKLYDDLQNGKLALDVLSQTNVMESIASVESAYKQEVQHYQKKQKEIETRYKSLINKVTKVTQDLAQEKVSYEDLNLALTPFLVYKETETEVILEHDTTSFDTIDSYEKEDFFKQYMFIKETDSVDTILFGEQQSFDFYTYILSVNGQRWFITYFNEDKNNLITAEFLLGYIVSESRLINILKQVIQLKTK
ncbi:hypothetical protein [Bacillus cereus group sp. TH152-1LC]|uniref:hypothetical protein n=1 Tax=Bacillus cereus group sp. TH152-1LC TaxID=3018060 RepID=UPI0022E804CC|nr:hypothetical protein [Bacillus cereus group sp. TH152-1LC]MDA1675181.1 hypothetical protein [Bacillus cereus group sp. TH152-1LC]